MSARAALLRTAIRLADCLHRPFRIPPDDDPFHSLTRRAFERINSLEEPAMLEIGSRNVTGDLRRKHFTNLGSYVGVDILAGENVDIVGDVHRLSEFVPHDHFDVVLSASVFEHLLFPWKAALEINRVTKVGGLVFTATHTMWPEHEMPWDFWRFPHMGFHALFNHYTGFEILDLAEGVPARIYSMINDPPTLAFQHFTVNGGVACLARKTGPYRDDLLRWDVDTSFLGSMYPSRTR